MARAGRSHGWMALAAILMAALLIGPLAYGQEVAEPQPTDTEDIAWLLQSGSEKLGQQDYEGAVADFQQAVELDPTSEYARRMLDTARQVMEASAVGDAGTADELLKKAQLARQIQIQMAKIEMENHYNNGVALHKDGKYEDAIPELQTARDRFVWLQPQAPDVAKFGSMIDSYLSSARTALKTQEEKLARERKKEAEQLMRERERRLAEFEKQRIAALYAQAREQYYNGNYAQAHDLALQVLHLDPNHWRAEQIRRSSERRGDIQRVHDLRAAKFREEEAIAKDVTALSVPQSDLLTYPDNWAEIEERARGLAAITVGEEEGQEWKKQIRNALQQPVSFDFADTDLEEVRRFLQAYTGVNFVLDRKALEGKGELKVTLTLNRASLEAALKYITGVLGLDYTLKDEAVFITTPEEAKGKPVLRLYDVSDLTVDIRDFRITTQAITLGEDSDTDEGLFPGQKEESEERGFTGQSLVEFIKRTIEPESWEGGAGGAAGGLGGW